MAGQHTVRQALTMAAIELFATRGYDVTTVDEIAARAGVARRTFFRHFRSKEDAVFPDHDAYLDRVEHFLATASQTETAVDVLCRAAHLVLSMYIDDPPSAVRRYQLTRTVPALREREITASSRYQRVFTRYLHRRSGVAEETGLRSEVAAAAMVAAHNQVLRQWLRGGGSGDPHPRLEEALGSVTALLGPWLAGGPAADDPDEVVVVVMPRGTPMWRVAQQVQAATRPVEGG